MITCYIIILILFILYYNDYIYEGFDVNDISISKTLKLSDNCYKLKKCKDYGVDNPLTNKCINKKNINLIGFDKDKLNDLVTQEQYNKGECCCTTEENCEKYTGKIFCHDFRDFNLTDDICTKYDNDKLFNDFTIEEYLKGDCCNTVVNTCTYFKERLQTAVSDPCINKENISLSGYDVSKYDDIVTEEEFYQNRKCCCIDDCDPSTLQNPDELMCHNFREFKLTDDVCSDTGYDVDELDNDYTIEKYLNGVCCKKTK